VKKKVCGKRHQEERTGLECVLSQWEMVPPDGSWELVAHDDTWEMMACDGTYLPNYTALILSPHCFLCAPESHLPYCTVPIYSLYDGKESLQGFF